MNKRLAGYLLAMVWGMWASASLPARANGAEPTAAARIEAMAQRLSQAQRISVTATCTYDVLQASGEMIEFGERRVLTFHRPDRARVDVTRRDGSRRGLVFDGKELTAFDLDANVYASLAQPGTVDAALRYYVDELKMRLPLHELFAVDLPRKLTDSVASAHALGRETIAGVVTEHVAYRGNGVDVQLWIARDGDPLPQRIVITYRMAAGQPQFAADFHDWNLEAEVSETTFAFVPAAGAEKISFAKRPPSPDEK